MNWAQILFNSLVSGSLYLIAAIGLTLTYGLSRFPNFAHAEFMALGAYAGYALAEQLGAPFPFTFVVAFIASGILGFLSYRGVFQPLAKRGATIIHLMIASIALGFIVRHTVGEVWGWSPLSFSTSWSYISFGGISTANIRIWFIFIALAVAGIMHLVLSRTRIGKAIRATSSNPELALSSGININRVTLFTWFLGAGLAGIAGLFRASTTRLSPLLGWDILLPTFAVTILGGIGSFYGAVAAAFIIGFVENVGVALLASAGISTEYRMAIAFVILIVTLLIRPQGLSRM
ncbi:MAG: branched-chain amino acid ABC transporter permease, partial [Chloroflexota bacterium]|nr:branched-chain amino acid ABC transporter permease [Chloroflexota bacterium]